MKDVVPSTKHQAPSTKHQAPSTKHQALTNFLDSRSDTPKVDCDYLILKTLLVNGNPVVLPLVIILLTLGFTSCMPDEEIGDSSNIVFTLDDSYSRLTQVQVSNYHSIPSFHRLMDLDTAIHVLISLDEEDAENFYRLKEISTLRSALSERSMPVQQSLNNSSLASIFMEWDSSDTSYIPTKEVMFSMYSVLSPEGLVVLDSFVGFFSMSLQCWAPLNQRSSLENFVLNRDMDPFPDLDIIYDYRDETWMLDPSNLQSRGNEYVTIPCPWPSGGGSGISQWSPEATNWNSEENRQLITSWRHEQAVLGRFPNRTSQQALTTWAQSRKNIFRYRTDHHFNWNFFYIVNDGRNIERNHAASRSVSRQKNFGASTIYRTVTGIRNSEELQASSTRITRMNGDNTWHSHRGMAGDLNILRCR